MGYTFTRKESHKLTIFLLTFISYAFFHANRKAFSNVKTTMQKVWTPSDHNATVKELKPDVIWNSHDMFDNHNDVENYEGLLDTLFMVAYAVGLFVNGYIGDRVDMRILLSIGMTGTSVLVFIFGFVCEWASFYNKYFYAGIWILNGLFQSTGWPIVVACMGNWFGHGGRGVLLGLWGSCASVGNIIGALLVSSALSYGYEFAFLITSSIMLSGAIFIFVGLVPSPADVGICETSSDQGNNPSESVNDRFRHDENGTYSYHHNKAYEHEPLLSGESLMGSDEEISVNKDESIAQKPIGENEATVTKSLSFWKAVLLPGVIPYSLAYAFLKLVNYSFFFWLPFYLSNAFHWKEAESDRLSTAYDVAGIVGGTICGFISDRLGKRTVLIVPMLLISIPTLYFYSRLPNDRVLNIAVMSAVGFFVGGSANLISAAVAADLGSQLEGDSRALSTVTGVIDGTGSVGAALGQIVVPHLQTAVGWHSVFYLFMVCMFLTAVCLFPLFVKEAKTFRCIQALVRGFKRQTGCCGAEFQPLTRS